MGKEVHDAFLRGLCAEVVSNKRKKVNENGDGGGEMVGGGS